MIPTGDEIGARMARQTLNTAAVKADCVYCGDREFIAKMKKTETGHLCHACAAAGKAPVIVEKLAEITKPENAMKKIRTFVCTYCGKPISKGNMTKLAGKWACRDCEAGKFLPEAVSGSAIVRLSVEYAGSKKCFYCGKDLFRLYSDGTAECACGKKYGPEGIKE